jgi:hypothetical protein
MTTDADIRRIINVPIRVPARPEPAGTSVKPEPIKVREGGK